MNQLLKITLSITSTVPNTTMPPKSILKKKAAPGRTATGKRARPGQNLRKAAKAEAESAKSKSKYKRPGVPGPGKDDTFRSGKPAPEFGIGGGARAGGGEGGRDGKSSKHSVKLAVGKGRTEGSKPKTAPASSKGKKRAQVAREGSDDDDGEDEDDDNDFGESGDDGAGTDEEIERLQDTKSSSAGTSESCPLPTIYRRSISSRTGVPVSNSRLTRR